MSESTSILDRLQRREAKAAAEALGIAPQTADRHWLFARAWLRRAIRGDPSI